MVLPVTAVLVVSSQYFPGSHGVHSSAASRCVDVLYEPARHGCCVLQAVALVQ